MTEIDNNIKFGMVEAISHLVHRDYDAIVEDFVTLDFIPPGTDLRPILPVLAKVRLLLARRPRASARAAQRGGGADARAPARAGPGLQVFDQALAGGGAKSINFQELAADLAQVTFDYPFRIPPYFALIIRAIGEVWGRQQRGGSLGLHTPAPNLVAIPMGGVHTPASAPLPAQACWRASPWSATQSERLRRGRRAWWAARWRSCCLLRRCAAL